jgi:DNA-binding transcriptional MocR family regulator
MELESFVTSLGSWPSGQGPLNRKLAHAIQRAIASGVISPGVRLPAERALAKALAVSRATVVSAYAALSDAEWLESRRGSGTYVRRVGTGRAVADARMAGSSPLFGLMTHDRELIDMALGTPYELGLRRELFTSGREEESALLADRMYYPLGLAVLRQALAKRMTATGFRTSEDQILITSGAQQAISLIAALYLQRGDAALVEDPTYFGAIEAFRATGARVSSVPVGAEGVAPGVLRDRIATIAPRLIYLTPTYQNPTGAVMPAAARRSVSKLSKEFGVPVIDDASLADIVLEGAAPGPIAAHGEHEGLLTVGSISKLIWPGLRIGWVRAAPPVIERLARIKIAHDIGSPLQTQAVGAQLVRATAEVQRLRREQLRPRRTLLAQLLKRQLPQWRFKLPEGGLFFWTRLPAGDARELAQVALRHGVLILPGSTMSAAGLYTRYVRLPFVADPDVLRDGIARLAGAWREYQAAPAGAGTAQCVSAIA